MGKRWNCLLTGLSVLELSAVLLYLRESAFPLSLCRAVLLCGLSLTFLFYYLLAAFYSYMHPAAPRPCVSSLLSHFTLWTLYLLCWLCKLNPYRYRSLFQFQFPLSPSPRLFRCMLLFHLLAVSLPCILTVTVISAQLGKQPEGWELGVVLAVGVAAASYFLTLLGRERKGM